MTPPPAPPSSSSGDDSSPDTERLPASSAVGDARIGRTEAERAQAIAVLDEPLDDKDLREQIRRPGLQRSTRMLVLLLAAVVVFGLGALLGRATAPDTGPGSAPDVVGAVESVTSGTAGGAQLTVRTGDGALVVLATTPGTTVGVPRASGLTGLRPGEQVVVGAERNRLGGLDATTVDVTPAR